MTDTDKIVAAIFAAASCANSKTPSAQYVVQYDFFLKLLKEHGQKTTPEPQLRTL